MIFHLDSNKQHFFFMATAALASADMVSATWIAACSGVSPGDKNLLQSPDAPCLSCTATWPHHTGKTITGKTITDGSS